MADRDFKGVWIPKEIWIDTNLTLLEKCIYVEIDSLDQGAGCFATNAYLAEFCNCSERKVTEAIFKLDDYGLIWVETKGRQRLIHSEGSRICYAGSQNLLGRAAESARQGSKICDHNNIDYKNNLINKSSNKPSVSPFKKPTVEEVEAYCKERNNNVDAQRFIDYYESVGWKRGKVKISDWKACVRTWERNDKPKKQEKSFEEIIADIKEGRVSDF